MKHVPVLLNETLDALAIKADGIYVDATFGYGGHSKAILARLSSGKLLVFDQDLEAIETALTLQKDYPNQLIVIHDNYANIKARLNEYGIEKVDGILADCGVSSMQFDQGERGFSYRFDAILDMRMNQSQGITAKDIVNTYDASELLRVLYDYGQEKFAKGIVKEIMKARAIKPIETTFELVELIKKGYPKKALSNIGHPAKQTFQALRIEVNDELRALQQLVVDGLELLKPQGVMAIISFHSLEDKIVKDGFNLVSKPPKTNIRLPMVDYEIHYELVHRKVVVASEAEIEMNPRAKSAKLRAIRRR